MGQALTHKILRQGYYWPTLHKDCLDYVKACAKCQLYGPVPRLPPAIVTAILSPIPFDTWGMDLMGAFPPAKGNVRFLVVAVDYMTKWVCRKFFHEAIVTQFGIPQILITNNSRQFVDADFEEYLVTYGIQHRRSSVAYPQSNGQVEVTNRSLLQSLRKNVQEKKNL